MRRDLDDLDLDLDDLDFFLPPTTEEGKVN